jgi:RNA 2',3'-cyclic 3'-phosphodiesterase
LSGDVPPPAPVARLFVAIDLPEPLKAALAALRSAALPARWSAPEKFHLTLRFIGEVDEARVAEIDTALRGIDAPRFALTLAGVGHFRRQVLWVGVESAPPLLALQAEVERALQRAGLPGERGRYVPHVKLARLRWPGGGRLRAFLAEHGHFRAEPFAVDRFVLYESRLARDGATHRRRAEYGLRAPSAQSDGSSTAAGPSAA